MISNINKIFNTTSLFCFLGTQKSLGYFFLGDEGFGLSNMIMRPYSQAAVLRDRTDKLLLFNYHLSRARRVVEDAFGLLCQRFRIFFTPIDMHTKSVDLIIVCCCIIHNFMCDEKDYEICDNEEKSTATTTWFQSFEENISGRYEINATETRGVLTDYFYHKNQQSNEN